MPPYRPVVMGPRFRGDDGWCGALARTLVARCFNDDVGNRSVPRAFELHRSLRMIRVIEHVFAEVALAAVGFGLGCVALDVAVLAAGGVFGRTRLHIVGAAIGVVVINARRRDRRRVVRGAGGKEKADDRERDQTSRSFLSHANPGVIERTL
jgi:hypothetical protein